MISFLKRIIKKFYYAFTGCIDGILYDKSIRLQVGISFLVILFGIYVQLHIHEWMAIIGMIGFVVALEYVNSAIEGIVDMISPDYHPMAKKIKDYAAAAVLIASITASMMAVFILMNRL